MVSSPTVQESEAIAPKLEIGVSVQKGPSLSMPQSKEEAVPTEMEPLRVNVGDTK